MPVSMKDPNMQKALDFLDQCLSGQKDFTQANLAGIVLHRAILGQLILDGATLTDARLENMVLRQASLIGTQLDRAKLNRASLIESNFSGASLQAAQFQEADLSQASLMEADLRDADLTAAQLAGANLQGANLLGAHVVDANFKGATYSDHTQFDPSFDPEKAGMSNIKDLELSSPPTHASGTSPSGQTSGDDARYIYYRGARVKQSTQQPTSQSSPSGINYRGAPAAAPSPPPKPQKTVRRYRGAIISD